MELDSQNLNSDGVELSGADNGGLQGSLPEADEENQSTVLEAKTVYILLPKNIPISRATRLQWLLDHLNSTIVINPSQMWDESSTELEVISALPREQISAKCNRFKITPRTEIKFLSHSYRFVYCLDMSPSQATVDIQKGEILFDEVLNCFKASVEGLSRQFTVPGNSSVFQPSIYLTVIVNTPFFMSPAQQVLVKGVQILQHNLRDIISYVQNQFLLIEGKIANVSAKAQDQIENQKAQYEGIVGRLFDLPDKEKGVTKIPMVSPDANFVNMLRYSMLAISLLPENSLSHILVITDGVVAMPEFNIMESLLFQLHYDSIAVSFLKVGSTFHPHSSSGYVSYTDLLHFFAHSTLGTCLETIHEIKHEPSMSMNVYHDLFLVWTFHTINKYTYPQIDTNRWSSPNELFRGHRTPNLLSKRQSDENASASMLLLLSRRMREGFTVDNLTFLNGHLEIKLSLQWKSFIFIHYKVSSQWPVLKTNTRFEIHIAAPYEFLHDITCMIKKQQKSLYRQAIIERFWMRLSHLSSGDLGLAQQLSSFQTSSFWYSLPESVKSGIPVFILNNSACPESTKLILTPSDLSCPKFTSLWLPICQMEGNNWRKWFHTHKISLILKHDQLPKHLHTVNASQRYQTIQCRQATAALYSVLAKWASFVLIESNTYLKLLGKEQDKTPSWFCLVRITSKLPCAVLHLGFLTNTPGIMRHEVIATLKAELSSLTYLPSPLGNKENACCVLLEKPLEKILIRYERMPSDFNTVIFPDGTQPPHTNQSLPAPITGSLFTTLSRYLYHKRWIWSASCSTNRLMDTAVSRILSTLTRMRLKEGFSFAYSSGGIITMVLELTMEPNSSCVVQYVLFPPHHAWLGEDDTSSCSEEDVETEQETETELQLVTEVWIEPQYGKVQSIYPRVAYMHGKHYHEIADVISQVDLKCINSLLTMEHLSLLCQEKSKTNNADPTIIFNRTNSTITSQRCPSVRTRNSTVESPVFSPQGSQWFPILAPRIEHIPFKFDPISILPLCQQTELLFSLFLEEEKSSSVTNTNYDKANKLLLESIQDHLGYLHDYELDLSKEDSHRFTRQVLVYRKNQGKSQSADESSEDIPSVQWRCLVKGISVTHVIVTFIPAELSELRSIIAYQNSHNIPADSGDGSDRTPSRNSAYSDTPAHSSSSLYLPIYVHDCPLAVLVNAYINNTNEAGKDIFEDHRFKLAEFLQEDIIKLKEVPQSSPEPISEESDNSDQKNSAKTHCKALVLAHSKSFVLSLFVALHCGAFVHSSDVQSAMDQCEESVSEIDITSYIMTVCGHVKHNNGEQIEIQELHRATPCTELKSLHHLIKDKFFKMVNVGFSPVPTNSEFYFSRNILSSSKDEKLPTHDSDEEISNTPSEIVEFKSDKDFSIYSEGPHLLQRMESGISGISDIFSSNINPLFLHLICTIKYNGLISNTSVRVLPTCLGELIQNIDSSVDYFERSKFQATLDILCLTLPNEVQNVVINYSSQGMRTTSFCSDGFQPSIGSPMSEISFNSDLNNPEPIINLPDYQRKTIIELHKEIRWLLKDEIATALLDIEPVTIDTLNLIINHVTQSCHSHSSCDLDVINLNFVYGPGKSHDKFIEEFSKISIPEYKLYKEEEFYYLAKDPDAKERKEPSCVVSEVRKEIRVSRMTVTNVEVMSQDEVMSQQSDISSVGGSNVGTDGGYDEDVSEVYEDFEWLSQLSNKRRHLPNFWLIMKIEIEAVTIYFHCRFLDLPTSHIGVYLEVQRSVRDAVIELCKKVNQSLLLQSLYETKNCDPLLEPEDTFKDWYMDPCSSPGSRSISSFSRLKSMDENTDDCEIHCSASLSEVSLSFKSGYFSCPVVWETDFVLHPRLKTGPGKSGISRGILALKNILDKFSVLNRHNMFVYRDNQNNVFYLRLHENASTSRSTLTRSNEYESVSRSPSIVSLPLGPNKSILGQSEMSIASTTSSDIRPRVRSFGEKEIKEDPSEDILTLKVHGITEAGPDVQCDLVQVLQNRLDDAVLEFLSITLARNAMCPLTSEDVHFIQKPFRPPEIVIRLTIEDFALQYLESFIHYLKQNLLQFLNIPKYADVKSPHQFRDYLETDLPNNKVTDDNIFIFNQSQNPSSGSRGISCIALALICDVDIVPDPTKFEERLTEVFNNKLYEEIINSYIIESDDLPGVYLEFRLWKQGRVNIDNLTLKLKSAVCQATWDIVMEYFLLKEPLCVQGTIKDKAPPIPIESFQDLSKEIEFNITLKGVKDKYLEFGKKGEYFPYPRRRNYKRNIPVRSKTTRSITFDDSDKKSGVSKPTVSKPTIKLSPLETGDEGILGETYSTYLPCWLEFGYNIQTPSIKKHRIPINCRHVPYVIVKELLSLVQETPKPFHGFPLTPLRTDNLFQYAAYQFTNTLQKGVIVSRNFEQWKASNSRDSEEDLSDFVRPQALKQIQKFIPAATSNGFIPRQKIFWAMIESDYILLYTYNWTKENIDKLIMSCTNLSSWLNVRSSFLNSIVSQKLGIFHNQPLARKSFLTSNNPYVVCIGNPEYMMNFPKDVIRRNINQINLGKVLEAFRDHFRQTKYVTPDPVITATNEIIEAKMLDEKSKEEMKHLHAMYQSRTSSASVPQILLLLQNSRILHYCHTPLLFLPRWRLKTAATRDPSKPLQIVGKLPPAEENWHTELCYSFFTEYRRYLQTLGFMPLQFDNNQKVGLWAKDNSSHDSVFYIQKTILGGILLFTVEFVEPFFTTKLYAIECNRLQNISSRASINRFTLSFLDECDKVKTFMHLHSFTYDYHLRCIYNYISNTSGVNKVNDKYNVNQFLDDFMKYYNKAPNFARNLIHADTLTIQDLVTEGKQLFDYLLSNVDQYNFKIMEMEKSDSETEHILVQVTTTSQISYKDEQDRQHTDDFDITLVVYNLCTPYAPTDKVLHLKYYLILTSKREMYPKSDIEHKLGKFRTVSSTARSLSALERTMNEGDIQRHTSDTEGELTASDEHVLFSVEHSPEDTGGESSSETQVPYIEISQESVNYLGYYSSHEQLMQQLILDKASTTRAHIRQMVAKGMVHCRIALLWNKLVLPHEVLTYDEFIELKSLAKLEPLSDVHPNLGPLLNQPLSWFEGLSKLLLVKYSDQNRTYTSPDGNIQHLVILHPKYFGAFMLLSMDTQTARGDLYAVYREPTKQEDEELCLAYGKDLLDGFVNCICFYLWSGMIC